MGFHAALAILLAASASAASLTPLPDFSKPPKSPAIVAPCVPHTPWTVAGEHGALFGRQNGKFEAWLWPVKILSNFAIRAELADYAVPIDVNALASQITVTPAETVITYSHAAFTIRQHMFTPRGAAPPATGAVVYFEIASIRPLDVTFSFTPEMLRMWPAPNYGRPNGEWVSQGANGGVYVLHTDNPQLSAIVAMPHTNPGTMVPYQEHPQTFPLELRLAFDPKKDAGMAFPLILSTSGVEQAFAQASTIAAAIQSMYAQTQDYYGHFFDRRVTASTPDYRLDEALQWAEVSVDQMQVQYKDEIGMVAGYYESADSARPGYAWFFGRDTLWTTYAVNSYGDFALTKRALDFLIRRQRDDGKIMHEFSQSADALDWKSTPYFYASADASTLLPMALADYVAESGDMAYLKQNWEAAKKAYAFTRAHESEDGIYNNSQGTGWVESWPPGMPHQEIYLAALDAQSAAAVSRLAGLMGEAPLAASAHKKAAEIRQAVESEYYDPTHKFYAFSRNLTKTLDETASIYPAVAWWDGNFALAHADEMLSRWASHEFSTDWGTRDISASTPFYDPISYHQGSIWPLFTGWVSLAEYRAGRSLSAYAHLMQNANLTWAQDLGSATELLSGEFYEPLGRSSSHQMWSSAMVIAPMLRGLFGVSADAPSRTLHLTPHLPAQWDRAKLRNVPLGSTLIDLEFERTGAKLNVRARTARPETFCLAAGAPDAKCKTTTAVLHTVSLPLRTVELGILASAAETGAVTKQVKVLSEEYSARQAAFTFEAPGGLTYELPCRINGKAHVMAQGGEMGGGKLRLTFPAGAGYQGKTVTFSW